MTSSRVFSTVVVVVALLSLLALHLPSAVATRHAQDPKYKGKRKSAGHDGVAHPPGSGKGGGMADLGEALGGLASLFGGGGGAGECVYTCPKGQRAIPRPGHKQSSNGCGSMGIKIKTGKFDFEPCCHIHDHCYDTCGEKRDECDEDFKKCMDKICAKAKSRGDPDVEQCQQTSSLLGVGSSMMGCQAYKKAQATACKCVDAGEL